MVVRFAALLLVVTGLVSGAEDTAVKAEVAPVKQPQLREACDPLRLASDNACEAFGKDSQTCKAAETDLKARCGASGSRLGDSDQAGWGSRRRSSSSRRRPSFFAGIKKAAKAIKKATSRRRTASHKKKVSAKTKKCSKALKKCPTTHVVPKDWATITFGKPYVFCEGSTKPGKLCSNTPTKLPHNIKLCVNPCLLSGKNRCISLKPNLGCDTHYTPKEDYFLGTHGASTDTKKKKNKGWGAKAYNKFKNAGRDLCGTVTTLMNPRLSKTVTLFGESKHVEVMFTWGQRRVQTKQRYWHYKSRQLGESATWWFRRRKEPKTKKKKYNTGYFMKMTVCPKTGTDRIDKKYHKRCEVRKQLFYCAETMFVSATEMMKGNAMASAKKRENVMCVADEKKSVMMTI